MSREAITPKLYLPYFRHEYSAFNEAHADTFGGTNATKDIRIRTMHLPRKVFRLTMERGEREWKKKKRYSVRKIIQKSTHTLNKGIYHILRRYHFPHSTVISIDSYDFIVCMVFFSSRAYFCSMLGSPTSD